MKRIATIATFAVLAVAPAVAGARQAPTAGQATHAIKREWRRARRPVVTYGCHREHRGVTRCMSKVTFVAYMYFNGRQRGTATVFTKETVRWEAGRLVVNDDGASTAVLSFP